MGTFSVLDAQRITSAHHQTLSVFTISGASLQRKAPHRLIYKLNQRRKILTIDTI
jgi:hypothetical protein